MSEKEKVNVGSFIAPRQRNGRDSSDNFIRDLVVILCP
jgi:hypothetical protein